ncbi:MAG TPA: hypothetical protein ENJ01_08715 [Gammaproteobacteria bacterium]|nr:hypothetical protein [Gammaproteobacteria bacterium]
MSRLNRYHARFILILHIVFVPLLWAASVQADEGAEFVATPYVPQKVIFDFYFDDPQKINAGLYWIRSFMGPLLDEPYGYAPEMLDIKVVIHGTEIVTLARKNYAQYRDAVERMRYYAELGVEFKVCALAARDFDYTREDFQDFVQVVPSAMTELVHWQMQGYGLITPRIMNKHRANDEIR